MKRLLLVLLLLPASASAQDVLRIDPMTLVALREARTAAAELDLFPGWNFADAPVLLYRPGVQDVLLNMPDVPDGFVRFTGPSPLGDEPIWVRNDSTLFDQDGQNTAAELNGRRVLVVADPASQARNQIRTFGGMTAAEQEVWLEEWQFLGSPYDLITTMLHEGFHVHQYAQGDKFASETLIARYPLYDATNGALHELEGLILLAAARGETPPDIALRQFAAVRTVRHAALGQDLAGYEMANEYAEGLAKYVEYRFYTKGASLTPHPEMYLSTGFDGYSHLSERFKGQLAFAERLFRREIAVNNDRFGAGNLRLGLYPMGALEGMLLDRVAPGWTARVFDPGVFPSTLLVEAAGLSEAGATVALAEAKTLYGYDAILAGKQVYEHEGKAAAQAKVDVLLGTDQTLVRIEYGALSQDPPGLGFTPFGVTPLGDGRTLYELVPIRARFGDGARLSMRIVTPVMVDTDRREVVFAVPVPASEIAAEGDEIRNTAFSLKGRFGNVAAQGNVVRVRLN